MANEIFTTNCILIYILDTFLEQFTWKPSWRAKDLAAQKREDRPMVGICYDAAKYLAQKLDGVFDYTAYWVCGYGIKSILRWFTCNALHSFLIVKVEGYYFFADCFMAPLMLELDQNNHLRIKGYATEEEAIKVMAMNIAGNDPYVIRTFNPLKVKMGNHILYSIRRMLNCAD